MKLIATVASETYILRGRDGNDPTRYMGERR